ncbi:MAG: acyltransferase [Bacteroidota bacterium]|nr:acyltransferase [Bacteroidota bacterium]
MEVNNHPSKYLWLDLLRGLSALVVLSSHLRSIIFDDFQNVEPDKLAYVFYMMTGFGHEAVIIFFTLSGFFIIKNIHSLNVQGKWSGTDYIINRITRLWVVLIPALFFTAFIDQLGLLFFSGTQLYSGAFSNMPAVDPINNSSSLIFIGNIFFYKLFFSLHLALMVLYGA